MGDKVLSQKENNPDLLLRSLIKYKCERHYENEDN
jgi:hypothetical protein